MNSIKTTKVYEINANYNKQSIVDTKTNDKSKRDLSYYLMKSKNAHNR